MAGCRCLLNFLFGRYDGERADRSLNSLWGKSFSIIIVSSNEMRKMLSLHLRQRIASFLPELRPAYVTS
jgi:hypothetical protein